MLGFIGMILAAIVGFGSGSTGLGRVNSAATSPITMSVNAACYNPQPGVRLTLKWPDNFINLKDDRKTLNPKFWANADLPPTFNSEPDCQNLVMGNQTTRTYILVRTNTRIPSCKTDEGAGPYGRGGECPPAATYNRGSCSINGYTDLRKVAEVKDTNGNTLEISWNPFSYNVGCNYRQDVNCGPGERRNINLKDFIYVLRKRDAFDPDKTNQGCPVRWDAGAANGEACSHFYDVYMAEDLYNGIKSAPASTDPESEYYFIKQVLENCQEKSEFIPAPEANFSMPPLFIKSPFIWQNDKNIYTAGKIVPGTSQENLNYNVYIWTFPNVFYNTQNASTINLLRLPTDVIAGPLKLCQNAGVVVMANGAQVTMTPTPPPNKNITDCYDSLGSIFIKDDKGQNIKFKAYSKLMSPQTFMLVRDGDPSQAYVYTITEKDCPRNDRNDKSLQLRVMQMITKNTWTWATPWCKPAIYMYPEKTTSINVKLNFDGQLTVSNPIYDVTNGWNIVADPSGRLITPLTLSDYPYLYYEADLKGVNIPKEGFVYSRQELPDKLKSLMTQIGFNEKETADFLVYWLPRLTEKPYYFVTLLPEDIINQKEKLTFSVTPNTLIRSRFVFEGLDAPISVQPLTNVQTHSRTGFTVTDWGGTLVGKSCTDVTVK